MITGVPACQWRPRGPYPAIAPRAIRNGGFSGIVKPRRPETVAGVTSGPNITIHVVSDLFSSTAPDPRYCYPVGWPGNVR
jgi:hypothetical protein